MIAPKLFDLLLWFDSSWTRYWYTLWFAVGFWFLSAILPWQNQSRWWRWNSPRVFVFLLFVALLAGRWPAFGVAHEFNPDESQFIAGALTMVHHRSLWWVDAMSSGAISVAPLTLPGWLGWPINYTTGRCLALFVSWGTLVFTWLAIRTVVGDRLSRLLVLPMAIWTIFCSYEEFVQYSSEHLPLLLLALALWLLVSAFTATGNVSSRGRLAWAGLILGVLPFTKLQASPLGLALGLFALVGTLRQAASWRQRVLDACILGGAALGAVLFIGLTILASKSGADWYHGYISYNLLYTQTRAYTWSESGDILWFVAHVAWGFPPYLWPSWALIALGLLWWSRVEGAARWWLPFAGIFFVAAYFTVGAPGRYSQHYLQFLVLPSTFLIALLYGGVDAQRRHTKWLRIGSLLTFLALGLGPPLHFYYFEARDPHVGKSAEAQAQALGPVARLLRPLQRPGDTLAVWGWACRYYVQTQLPQATHESHSERQVCTQPGPLRVFFTERYLNDLRQNRPAFFLDAVGKENFGFTIRAIDGHESFPALREYIAENYRLIGDLETTRVYCRRDRLPASAVPSPP